MYVCRNHVTIRPVQSQINESIDNESKTLTSNYVIHLLQGSLQNVAGIWRHDNKLLQRSTSRASYAGMKERNSCGMRDSERSTTQGQSVAGYSPSFSHLDPFAAKLQQLSSERLQVNNLLNVAFGFKLAFHFAVRALPIVSAVIHMRPKLIFRADFFCCCCFLFLLFVSVYLHSTPSTFLNTVDLWWKKWQ